MMKLTAAVMVIASLSSAPLFADDADVVKGLQNLSGVHRIANVLELRRTLAHSLPLQVPPDPWGTPYRISESPQGYRIVSAGSDKKFDDTVALTRHQFTGLEGDVVFENGNLTRTNHNWLCAQATPEMLGPLRRAEMFLLMVRTEHGRTLMALKLTAAVMQRDDVTAEIRDAWGTPLRIVEEDGRRRVISAAADRTFDPMSWNRAPAVDAAEDVVFEGGKFVRRVDERQLVAKLNRNGEPLPQPLERPLRDDPNNTKYLRVGDGVKAPLVVKRVEPEYPEAYRQFRITGIIILELALSETGAVDRVAVVKSLGPALDAAGIAAVRKWTFTPATRDGKPVPSLFNLTINFKLN